MVPSKRDRGHHESGERLRGGHSSGDALAPDGRGWEMGELPTTPRAPGFGPATSPVRTSVSPPTNQWESWDPAHLEGHSDKCNIATWC